GQVRRKEHEYIEVAVAFHPRVPCNGADHHPLRLPALRNRGKKPFGHAMDVRSLLRRRPELFSEDLLLKRQPFGSFARTIHHFTSQRSAYTGPREVSVLFLSFRPVIIQLPPGTPLSSSRHLKRDGEDSLTRASVA